MNTRCEELLNIILFNLIFKYFISYLLRVPYFSPSQFNENPYRINCYVNVFGEFFGCCQRYFGGFNDFLKSFHEQKSGRVKKAASFFCVTAALWAHKVYSTRFRTKAIKEDLAIFEKKKRNTYLNTLPISIIILTTFISTSLHFIRQVCYS